MQHPVMLTLSVILSTAKELIRLIAECEMPKLRSEMLYFVQHDVWARNKKGQLSKNGELSFKVELKGLILFPDWGEPY